MYKDFAFIYDKVMSGADYDEWYVLLKDIIKKYKISEEKILDLGCGTGEILIRFAKDNCDKIIGVDLSSDMLAVANNKIEKESFETLLVNQDMRELELNEEFTLVVSIFDTINHLTSLEDLEIALKKVYLHLEEDGYFVFDVVTRKLMDEMFLDGMFFDDREDLTIIWQHEYDELENLDNIDTTFFINIDEFDTYKRVDEFHQKMIFTKKEIKEIAHKVGFKVVDILKNKDVAGERLFIILKK